MILIKTKHKILLARLFQVPIIFFIKLFKKTNKLLVIRNEIKWFLDLEEGIDFAIFLTGKFEIDTSSYFKSIINKGDIIFDIGANIGAHTLPMAKLVGENGIVHAFEPTKFAYDKLEKNISLNPNLNNRIIVNQIMLTDKKNKKPVPKLYSSWPFDSKLQEHKKHCGSMQSTDGCKSKTLDEYVLDNKVSGLKLIKIDVDGFEIEVLMGAKNILKKNKPILLIELAPYTFEERGKSFSKLINLLFNLGYALFDIKNKKKLPNSIDKLMHIIPEGGSINVIAKCIYNVKK